MREAPNCEKKCERRLVVRTCAENGLKCEYVRETAKSATPHPPHLIVASVRSVTSSDSSGVIIMGKSEPLKNTDL